MKSIELFVYDFDGTLMDTKRDIADSVNRVLDRRGLRTLPRETIYGYVGRGVDHLISRALEGIENAEVAQVAADFREDYGQHLLDQTGFFPEGREIVRHFSHKKNAICSNKPFLFIERILQELDFLQPFHAILGGDSVEQKKPDPMGLHRLMQQFGVRPDQVLMVGDSEVDMETGRRAGVWTCAITHGMNDRQTLEQTRPHHLIDRFDEMKRLFC